MDNKIENALAYYETKQREILKVVNSNKQLTVEDVIQYGKEMAVIEYKLTALEVARES